MEMVLPNSELDGTHTHRLPGPQTTTKSYVLGRQDCNKNDKGSTIQ